MAVAKPASNGSIVIFPTGRAPGAVSFVHHSADSAIWPDTVVAAGPQVRVAEVGAQAFYGHLTNHTVDGDGVDFVIARTIPVWTDYSHTA